MRNAALEGAILRKCALGCCCMTLDRKSLFAQRNNMGKGRGERSTDANILRKHLSWIEVYASSPDFTEQVDDWQGFVQQPRSSAWHRLSPVATALVCLITVRYKPYSFGSPRIKTQTWRGLESAPAMGIAHLFQFTCANTQLHHAHFRHSILVTLFMLPEADSRKRLTTAGHTHRHALLGPLPRRQKISLPVLRRPISGALFNILGPVYWLVEGVSATVFRKVLLQLRSYPGSMFEGYSLIVIAKTPGSSAEEVELMMVEAPVLDLLKVCELRVCEQKVWDPLLSVGETSYRLVRGVVPCKIAIKSARTLSQEKALLIAVATLSLSASPTHAGTRERGKLAIPEKTRRPTAPSGTIHTCGNPVTRPGIEPGSPWWEASKLTTQPPWPL
ncbi:hypothetical protein PR048_030447 [Dryococelus australis]|uniref:Uncharacterized protein n=1 Tax=Dryococelus australis TaxID=614101 RepID=A0ABQ9GCV3_9NEOP|nr:hypothetical protein PR048_030447 [Dryococelus australis]